MDSQRVIESLENHIHEVPRFVHLRHMEHINTFNNYCFINISYFVLDC